MKHIAVVGSINMDLVVGVSDFPKAGETKHAHSLQYFSGGKGANQAVAAAKNGAQVNLIGAVGKDSFAPILLEELKQAGVMTNGIVQVEGNTGLAVITVNEQGENQIILDPGANIKLLGEQANVLVNWQKTAVVLLQNEISWCTSRFIIEQANAAKIPVWLNPAPAFQVPHELLSSIDLLILNETEAQVVSGMEVNTMQQAKQAAQYLIACGARQVIVTLGEKGSVAVDETGNAIEQAAYRVQAKDTTAAGDTFIGSLAAAYFSHKLTFHDAMRYASAASALAVTKQGAQSSIPTKAEVVSFLAQYD